jgi:hypothetical protein
MTARDWARASLVILAWVLAVGWSVWITRHLTFSATLVGIGIATVTVIYLARTFR